ncbi:uncharacterized protein LOC128551006 [Mercenaria mercenaria]|uniref:uncharacterized protein LOC128551006 n=1 Tax=Mercenaria mercenaria TaxID=6596 RepID=UPI00234FB2D1|nr:uncharacterized protein LOC128551006 [Mercenaria mercenaria]
MTYKESTFTQPAGRDTSLDFYIDAITHELLKTNKRYYFHSSISQDEQIALKSLAQDDNIVIKKADKSSTIVIMNRSDYSAEVHRQLNNELYYKNLDYNPEQNLQQEILNTLNSIDCNDEELLRVPYNVRTPQFYVLPKIHKEHNNELPLGFPGKPIVSGCNSITENISAYLDGILKPHMENLPSYIRDSADFITKLKAVPKLKDNAFLVTLDKNTGEKGVGQMKMV